MLGDLSQKEERGKEERGKEERGKEEREKKRKRNTFSVIDMSNNGNVPGQIQGRSPTNATQPTQSIQPRTTQKRGGEGRGSRGEEGRKGSGKGGRQRAEDGVSFFFFPLFFPVFLPLLRGDP